MLGYFRDFINLYFFKPEYEVIPIKHMKSEWYLLKNLFNDENQDSQNNQDNQGTKNNYNSTK